MVYPALERPREQAVIPGGAPPASPPVEPAIQRTSEVARASIVEGAATTPAPPRPQSIRTIAAAPPEGSPPRVPSPLPP